MQIIVQNQLVIRKDKTFNYTSGQIYSVNKNFRYGYYEARVKVPTFSRSFPAFWLYVLDNPEKYEIDVMEYIQPAPNEFSTNYFYQSVPNKFTPKEPNINDVEFGFHTYAIDWSPDHIIWYFDNVLVRTVYDPIRVSDQDMYLILNLAIHPWSYTIMPNCTGGCDPFEVDYVRVYEHNCAAKGSAINQSNFFASPTYGVHKSYTLSNSTVPSGAHVVLRATDFVTLQNNFIVPAGSEFYVVMTQCP